MYHLYRHVHHRRHPLSPYPHGYGTLTLLTHTPAFHFPAFDLVFTTGDDFLLPILSLTCVIKWRGGCVKEHVEGAGGGI